MNFEKEYIYHIYNQGNNRRQLFFCRDNYLFFLEKIKTYILPYADILAWCLMPNHFHLMVYINNVEIFVPGSNSSDDSKSSDELLLKGKVRSLNNSIAIMLRSYTRAIQIQEGITGTLFRQNTKAECVNCPSGITPSFIIQDGITKAIDDIPEKQNPTVCFNYIHQNPVKAKLVSQASDWEFSSALDYEGLRKGNIVNKKRTEEYISLTSQGTTMSRTQT